MDWGLVLASQDIEVTVDYVPEEDAWSLVVKEDDAARAHEAIRFFRLENRRWSWRQRIPATGLLFDWTAVLWVLLLAVFFWVSETNPAVEVGGIMSAAKVVQGQWWRLFTAVWLHADAAHLAANATLGLVLLGLAMGRYGTGVALLATYVAGILGNVGALVVAARAESLGASGAVMGTLGLLGAQSFRPAFRTPQHTRYFITGLLGGFMLFVLFGLAPGTDVRAHFGGFLSGLLIGAAIATFITNSAGKPLVNLSAGLVFLTLVILPWWQAIVHLQ